MHNDELADIIVEIFDGVTVLDSSLGPIYVKHFHQLDTRKLLAKRDYYKSEAQKRGLMSEEESLKMAIDEGMWDEESEKEVREKKKFIENLEISLSKIELPSKKEIHKKLINAEKDKLNIISFDREKSIGFTAEKYADKKVNKDFFEKLLFLDPEFKKSPFEDLNYEDVAEATELTNLENVFFKRMSDQNISSAVLSSFFSPYLPFAEDVLAVFGEPLKNLTSFQLKMITYSRGFLNIFKNSQKEIPDHVAKDPELLVDFYNSQKDNKTNKNTDADGTTYFGANKDDIDQIKREDQDAIILSDEIKKKGGTLSMKDMMELHGL